MNFIKFKENLGNFGVISLSDIQKVDPAFHRRRLNEWQSKGYIKKILRGYYLFSDITLNELRLFEIANKIYTPSYISLESAFSYYGLIPESVYGITSISTRKTNTFNTPAASFIYHSVKSHLFWGYEIKNTDHTCFKIAVPEKALLDFFYLNPDIQDQNAYESLRMNKERFFKIIKPRKLSFLLKKFNQKHLKSRIHAFWEAMQHA